MRSVLNRTVSFELIVRLRVVAVPGGRPLLEDQDAKLVAEVVKVVGLRHARPPAADHLNVLPSRQFEESLVTWREKSIDESIVHQPAPLINVGRPLTTNVQLYWVARGPFGSGAIVIERMPKIVSVRSALPAPSGSNESVSRYRLGVPRSFGHQSLASGTVKRRWSGDRASAERTASANR